MLYSSDCLVGSDWVEIVPPNVLLQIHRFLSTIWKKVTPQLGEPIVPCVLVGRGPEGMIPSFKQGISSDPSDRF